MGKKQLVFLFVLITLLSACGPKLIPIDDDSVNIPAGVQIVHPQDQATIPPYHAAVVAVASLPSGIGGMEFSIDGNPPVMFEFPAHEIGSDYVENHAYWFPAHMGSTILSVVVFDMNGQPALSDQIEVFVEIEDPVDMGPVETYVAQTLTAIAEDQGDYRLPPTYTPTPEPAEAGKYSPCDLFDPQQTRLTLHDIQPGSNQLTFFLTFDFEVPGLEKRDEGDEQLYLYSAKLGSGEPVECTYQGYTRRLYCTKTLRDSELNSAQPLIVELNLCDFPIFSHSQVSLIAPVCTSESSQSDCEAFGGSYNCVRNICSCTCP